MNHFLQSNVTLLIGILVTVTLVALRSATQDKTLRADLRGAAIYFVIFLVLRSLGWALEEYAGRTWLRILRVGWMLAFGFGSVRTVVSIGLWAFRFRTQKPTPQILRDVIDGTLYAITAVPVLRTQLDIDITGVLATSAILSVVLGLALQDTLGNLFSGLSLQVERPFQVGDWVSIGTHSGQVAQVAWRATRIENFRRESITLPNNVVSKEAVKNFSRGTGLIGIDIPILADFDSPPNKVKNLLLDTARDCANVLRDPPPTCRVVRFADNGIEYLIRCYAPTILERENIIEELLSKLWYRFRREGVIIPVQQQVLRFPDSSGPVLHLAPPQDKVELLRSIDFLKSVPDDAVELLASSAQVRQFGRGERVLSEGTLGESFFIVARGTMSVRKGIPERELALLDPGQYFGEMSLLTGAPRSASVWAAEDSVLYEISRPAFARLFEQNPGLDRTLSTILAERKAKRHDPSEDTLAGGGAAPDENRILSRLKQIFGR